MYIYCLHEFIYSNKRTINGVVLVDTFYKRNKLKPGFHIVVSVVSVVSVLSKKFLRQIQPYGNPTHTSAQYDRYDRYNVLSEIEMILSPTTDTTGNGRDTTAFC